MTTIARHTPERVRSALNWTAEFVFYFDLLVLGLLVAILVIGTINPLDSAALTVFLAATAILLGVHHVWYARHRYELEHDPRRLAARERRGF